MIFLFLSGGKYDLKAKQVTEKMPQNFRYLGLIHILLPKAKIIHCRRNPCGYVLIKLSNSVRGKDGIHL